jgi:hypothetical protein
VREDCRGLRVLMRRALCVAVGMLRRSAHLGVPVAGCGWHAWMWLCALTPIAAGHGRATAVRTAVRLYAQETLQRPAPPPHAPEPPRQRHSPPPPPPARLSIAALFTVLGGWRLQANKASGSHGRIAGAAAATVRRAPPCSLAWNQVQSWGDSSAPTTRTAAAPARHATCHTHTRTRVHARTRAGTRQGGSGSAEPAQAGAQPFA